MMITSTRSTRLFTYLLLVICAVSFNSCKKEEEVNVNISYLRVFNASPTFGTYNLYTNDKMINTGPIPFGGSLAYAQFEAGTHSIKFTTAGDVTSLLTKQVTLAAKKVNTLYLIDKDDKLDAIFVVDGDAGVTSSDKAFVKFINLSPDAPALDLKVKDGASLVTSKAYKTGSEYAQIDPKTYSFEIKDSATGNVKTTLTDVVFTAGRYYTIISRGLLNPGTNQQPFSAQSIINQ